MKITIITNTLGYGGAERQRVHLANGLSERGHRVTVHCLQSGGALASMLTSRVDLRIGARPLASVLGTRQDCIIAGATRTELTAAWLLYVSGRTRSVVAASHHSFPLSPGDPWTDYPRDVKWLLRRMSIVISLTDSHSEHLIRTVGLTRVRAIKNGVPFIPPDESISPSLGQTRFTVLGRLTEQKGLDFLVDAWKRAGMTSRSRLDVFGEGPDGDRLKTLASHAPGIEFHSPTTNVADVLRETDWLLMPSRWEAQPMVILEALAHSVPVLGTPVGAIPEMIGDVAGCATIPMQDERWEIELKSRDGSHPEVDSSLLRRAQEYSIDVMVDNYAEAIADL